MKKQMPKTEPPAPAESRSQKPPIDLEALTPLERTRLDTAVMALVEYLVSASAKAA
jgi:hypothetical protein